MKERHKIIPASFLILKNNDKILLMRRFATGYFDGWYGLPSGHIEHGELPYECLIRETQEEIGITLLKADVSLIHTMYRINGNEDDRVDFFFLAEKWSGEIQNIEPNKCDNMGWYPLSQLPENLIPPIRVVIQAWQRGETYTDLPFNEQFRNPTTTQ